VRAGPGSAESLGRLRARQTVRYLLARFAVYLVTLWGAASLSFLCLRLMPGAPAGNSRWVNETLGRNGNLLEQYLRYFGGVVRGDFGASFLKFPSPAMDLVLGALPWTATLLAVSVLISWAIGLVVGAIVGWKRDRVWAQILVSVGIAVHQVHYYYLGLFLLLVFAYGLAWFPTRGAFAGGLAPGLNVPFVLSVIQHAALPSLSIVIAGSLGWMISTRALVVGELGADYIVYAQAKGLRTRTILFGYGLRNVLLPQVTGLAISLGFVVNGAILLEQLFLYPGVGLLFITAIKAVDVNTAQAIVTLAIVAVSTANLIVDLLLPLIDPRVQARV
jgi:peptide/nickel transport system permease protein